MDVLLHCYSFVSGWVRDLAKTRLVGEPARQGGKVTEATYF
jgi:hypothetical protein